MAISARTACVVLRSFARYPLSFITNWIQDSQLFGIVASDDDGRGGGSSGGRVRGGVEVGIEEPKAGDLSIFYC